ncbi:HAD-IB family phosphatase [Pseudonocardia xishanensis]|uniref:Phosphoserine phosphatase n=1 Tax=Pseudonocardia xishanensis TaxID=630995 RepID=A0ABP8S184_9PSEU
MPRLHVFDMDGTLLRGAATLELTRHFGDAAAGHAIEARWMAGDITDDEFWQTLLDVCGDASAEEVDAAFAGAPWMAGIADTFADIRARGEIAIVVSQSPLFFVRRLEGWGAHGTYGTDLELGRPLRPGATLSAAAKVEITDAVLARHGIAWEDCVAYGDSRSDLALFARLRHTVAVNASPAIVELAAARYEGTDIREAYALGRDLLAASATQA